MKRNFRGIRSFILAPRDDICFNHSSAYMHHSLRFLSRYPSIGTDPGVSRARQLVYTLCDNSIFRPTLYASLCTSIDGQGEAHSNVERGSESDAEEERTDYESPDDPVSRRDLETIVDILRTGDAQEKSKKLEQCEVNVTAELVANVLSRTRNDWETAFTFFLWAGKQPGYEHSVRECHSMIAILGKFRKFDTAWGLINDMKAASLVTPHTLLIMMRKYASVHDVGKAINTFYALRRFKFEIGMAEFQGLLSALCRYKNVKDAEHLLFCNRTVFPLNTKNFNIILNGWCNVVCNLRQGSRIWREMEVRGIRHDVYSYSSIMSCHSKVNHLNVVLRFYEQMKSLGIKPDRKVYNAVIHAMAKGRLVKEACNLMKTMEEKGYSPDTVTYNSLIMPLCKSRLLDEAKQVFDEMLERGILPNIRTYHGFFRVLKTAEEVFELLERMHASGCHPTHDTYIMLIRKFCRWHQLDNVFKLWGEMSKNGLDPDRSSYIVLIHGLFLNGRLEDAHKYYQEMKERDLVPEPKVDAMIQAWLAGRTDAEEQVIGSKDSKSVTSDFGNKSGVRRDRKEDDFRRKPELRSVTRERGFSFWDH